ncbi:Hypothetical predicted protein [Paramuricea clavata]|uniref:Uncharacterized protein n=1 Tax=Paramuricea clavata TaxID=317549 RepID=A0A6S7GA60_PARCT|nr:Hypothetical predicted protein [Paramuricea clavata]
MFGDAGHCGAAKICFHDLEIHVPAFKPKAQLMAAINMAMIQKDYGFIALDLTENKDSYNQILPNTTSGIVSIEVRLSQDLAANSQLIVIGEFRNQLSCAYQMEARLKFAY